MVGRAYKEQHMSYTVTVTAESDNEIEIVSVDYPSNNFELWHGVSKVLTIQHTNHPHAIFLLEIANPKGEVFYKKIARHSGEEFILETVI
jgi:hypothetical protein